MTDASNGGSGDSWYTPTWGRFFTGLVLVGAGVGIYFIVDHNNDDDDGSHRKIVDGPVDPGGL
jgi:hypothetical protein